LEVDILPPTPQPWSLDTQTGRKQLSFGFHLRGHWTILDKKTVFTGVDF